MYKIGNFTFRSGDIISCTIKGYLVKNGRIHFRVGDSEGNVRAWICHKLPECAGDESPDRHGMAYSWGFTIRDQNRLSDHVSNIVPYLPSSIEIKKINVDIELDNFLKLNQLEEIVNPLLYCKVGIFDDFNHYKISDTDGCIMITNGLDTNHKKIEIKLSRFVKQVSSKLNEIIKSNSIEKSQYSCGEMDITDHTIEKIHNTYVAYQKNGRCIITFLKGEDILKGYIKENLLLPEGGTLHKSCMVGYPQFLELYTKNPNQVQLAVVFMEDKVAARGLVWTATDGKMYSDRIYYKHDWLEKMVVEKLKEMDIHPVQQQAIRVVQLEKWEFNYYPYVDSFYSMDKTNGTLISFGTGLCQMRNTNGNMS